MKNNRTNFKFTERFELDGFENCIIFINSEQFYATVLSTPYVNAYEESIFWFTIEKVDYLYNMS